MQAFQEKSSFEKCTFLLLCAVRSLKEKINAWPFSKPPIPLYPEHPSSLRCPHCSVQGVLRSHALTADPPLQTAPHPCTRGGETEGSTSVFSLSQSDSGMSSTALNGNLAFRGSLSDKNNWSCTRKSPILLPREVMTQ